MNLLALVECDKLLSDGTTQFLVMYFTTNLFSIAFKNVVIALQISLSQGTLSTFGSPVRKKLSQSTFDFRQMTHKISQMACKISQMTRKIAQINLMIGKTLPKNRFLNKMFILVKGKYRFKIIKVKEERSTILNIYTVVMYI